jgi:hypothetical protein
MTFFGHPVTLEDAQAHVSTAPPPIHRVFVNPIVDTSKWNLVGVEVFHDGDVPADALWSPREEEIA